MRSQYEHSFAEINNNNYNHNTSNGNAIPYHARENSLPFSYGQIKPKSSFAKANANGSYYTMNTIGSGANVNKPYDSSNLKNELYLNTGSGCFFDTVGFNENCSLTNRSSNTNSNHNNQIKEASNDMIKTHTRLTSPLLVRKTFKNPNFKSTTTTIDAIRNDDLYNIYYRNSTNKENNLEKDEIDSEFKNDHISNNVPYVTLNGTLNKRLNNDNNINSKNITSVLSNVSTPHNYEEFEDLLLERREKVFNEQGISKNLYIDSTVTKKNNNNINLNEIMNDKKIKKLDNYDFEFNLLNLVDRQNDSGFNGFDTDEPPTPPRRNYSLEIIQKTTPRNNMERQLQTLTATGKSSIENSNWHTTPLPESSFTPTIASNTSKTHVGAFNMDIENSERPLIELNVGYKLHLETLQKQKEQWPDYNTTSKYNSHSSHETTYGNGNVAGYHNSNNHSIRKNLNSKDTDIRNEFDSVPIYATCMKKHQQEQEKIYKIKGFHDEIDFYRPETPAFPLTPRTPSLPNTLERENPNNKPFDTTYQSLLQSQMNSAPRSLSHGAETQEVAAHLVKFAKDSSKFWYKANLSREEAISLLLYAPPGTFVIRDSTTYKNAYGLVLRVSQPPPGAPSTGKPDDLVRHFLIEPTTRGVRLKGCTNEPVFTSLSALVYEHSINQLALPCLLHIPEHDLLPPCTEPTPAQQQLLTQGAACNVLLLFSAETESLTGEEAIRKAIRQMYEQKPLSKPIEVHFKVTQQGITLTDNTRKRFFRKHYKTESISYCAIDPDNRLWSIEDKQERKKSIFAFVARRSPSSKDNQCHIFCDLECNQPASAIVSFVNKTLPTDKQHNMNL